MRICFLCSEYPPGPHGGIGTSVQVLARGLAEHGHDVRVVGIYQSDYPAPDFEEDRGVSVWRMRCPNYRFGWIQGRWQLYRQVASWSKQGKVDIVEVPDYVGWVAGWPRLPVPVIVRLNGSGSYFAAEMNEPLQKRAFWLEKASLRRATFWCSVSQYTANKTRALFGLDSGPHAVIHNPVEHAPNREDSQREPYRIVFTGTLAEKKGILSLAAAWPKVVKAEPKAQLSIFGKDGRTRQGKSMRRHISEMLKDHVGRTVRLHDHISRDELFGHLSRASVAVFPSYAEAFALAPLEAMIRGCPTIYSRRGSGPELIEHGEHGLLVNPDEPEQIADAIVNLTQDRELADRLARKGRQRVMENFTISALLPKNENFYQKCIEDFHALGEWN